MFVPLFSAVTVTPGMTPPPWSVTVPMSLAYVLDWPNTAGAANSAVTESAISASRSLDMFILDMFITSFLQVSRQKQLDKNSGVPREAESYGRGKGQSREILYRRYIERTYSKYWISLTKSASRLSCPRPPEPWAPPRPRTRRRSPPAGR